MFIYLTIYSIRSETLGKVLKLIDKITENKTLKIKVFSKKNQKTQKLKTFAVLKSPHINKKAQEHFKLCKLKYKLSLNLFQIGKFYTILKEIQTQLFPNISIKLDLYLQYRKITTNYLNSDLFNLESTDTLLHPSTVNYLKILDTFGECLLKRSLSKIIIDEQRFTNYYRRAPKLKSNRALTFTEIAKFCAVEIEEEECFTSQILKERYTGTHFTELNPK